MVVLQKKEARLAASSGLMPSDSNLSVIELANSYIARLIILPKAYVSMPALPSIYSLTFSNLERSWGLMAARSTSNRSSMLCLIWIGIPFFKKRVNLTGSTLLSSQCHGSFLPSSTFMPSLGPFLKTSPETIGLTTYFHHLFPLPIHSIGVDRIWVIHMWGENITERLITWFRVNKACIRALLVLGA